MLRNWDVSFGSFTIEELRNFYEIVVLPFVGIKTIFTDHVFFFRGIFKVPYGKIPTILLQCIELDLVK